MPDGSGQVFLYASLRPAPQHGREAFFRHLLELNAYMIGSRGGALGLDPESDEIVLSRAEPIEALSAELFQRMLINFVGGGAGPEGGSDSRSKRTSRPIWARAAPAPPSP